MLSRGEAESQRRREKGSGKKTRCRSEENLASLQAPQDAQGS
jgi:hypothetical protein